MEKAKYLLKVWLSWCFFCGAVVLFAMPDAANKLAAFVWLAFVPALVLGLTFAFVKFDDWRWGRSNK